MIKVSTKVFEGYEQLGFTRMRFAEAMLDIRSLSFGKCAKLLSGYLVL